MLSARIIGVASRHWYSISKPTRICMRVISNSNPGSIAPSAEQQEAATDHDRSDPHPQRNVDRLLFLHRQFNRADFSRMGFLGVAETANRKAQRAGHDQNDRHDPDWVHTASFGFKPLESRARGA